MKTDTTNVTKTAKRAPVLAAMSGGVDSSVAALMLADAGLDVIGVFMRNGVAAAAGVPAAGAAAKKSCCSASDARDASRVAAKLGLPFYAVDYAAEFDRIIAHFADEYRRGRTPNPCVLCNSDLKFGHLFEVADDLGADEVATGHYARVVDGRLHRARDAKKDQSYYLFGVDRAALARVRFPLGDLTKAEVRERARAAGLGTAEKPESMEICFVTSGDYRDIVRSRRGAGTPGRFVDTSGRDVGAHDGVDGFTVGQRRGLPALGSPHFVKSIDPDSGTIVLGSREEVASREALVRGVNWLVDVPSAARPLVCEAKIRARSPACAVQLRVDRNDPSVVRVEFQNPEFAVTPGQAAVFYDGDLVLGGGWLD